MVYANSDSIQTLTNEVLSQTTEEKYTNLLSHAINHAERKIQSKLQKQGLTPPSSDVDLTEAANLYAAAFIFDTYYSGNETSSPTVKSYKADADEFVEGYINRPAIEKAMTLNKIGIFVPDIDEDDEDETEDEDWMEDL